MATGGGAEAQRRWALTADAFERLLAALDPDRERAAIAYEQLRRRIAGLMRWWGAVRPEDLADETLDRVARKLAEGAAIADGSLGAYVRGVARLVFYEAGREPLAQAGAREAPAPIRDGDVEAASECLDRCLAALPPSERTLLVKYYGVGKAAEVRRRIAADLGISPTALRIRAHRLRGPLEQCVTACLARRNFL